MVSSSNPEAIFTDNSAWVEISIDSECKFCAKWGVQINFFSCFFAALPFKLRTVPAHAVFNWLQYDALTSTLYANRVPDSA
jgi:hypothetical protein